MSIITVVAATHDDVHGLVTTLHPDRATAFKRLRDIFLTGEYDAEVSVPENASQGEIADALDRLPLFAWDVTSREVPS